MIQSLLYAKKKSTIPPKSRKRTKYILLYAFCYMSLFPGFPVKTGRVALTRQVQWAETACETVKFPPFSFYPDKEVHVQITTNHWNNSLSNYIHEATVSWVQLVNYEGFEVSKRLNSLNTFIYVFTLLTKLMKRGSKRGNGEIVKIIFAWMS